jgi:hypothetical protein
MFEMERLEPGKLPGDLANMAPGAEMARLLESLDRESVSGFDRVVMLQARARQVAHDQAEL